MSGEEEAGVAGEVRAPGIMLGVMLAATFVWLGNSRIGL